MKILANLIWILLLCISSYAQVYVETTLLNNSNTLNSQFTFLNGEDVTRDLFFSIGPNGVPQYGQDVYWNLSPGTHGITRNFHVKKGDWDRSAIRTSEEPISFTSSAVTNPVSATPNIDLGNDWIKLGKSWNFSHDNYSIVILSFTNQQSSPISFGRIKFSMDTYAHVTVPNIYVYNNWVTTSAPTTSQGRTEYEFTYSNLAPQEVRHVYIVIDQAKTGFKAPNLNLSAEMVNYQTAQLHTDDTFPPHDPNAITLLNAFVNTEIASDCSQYASIPALEEACATGTPYWIECPIPGDKKCPLSHSLDYPYCNEDAEYLTYRVSCLNDGQGYASHVNIITTFTPFNSPFEANDFIFNSDDNYSGTFGYPKAEFFAQNIDLPGLDDPTTVYTYEECSSSVIFRVKTLCNIYEEIDAQAIITFYDKDKEPVEDVATNILRVVPQQGIFTNYTPLCEECADNEENTENRSAVSEYQVIWTDSDVTVSFERTSENDQASIQILNAAGQLMQSRNIFSNTSIYVNERFNVSNLHSGLYFVAIQNGKSLFVEKFVKP
ncbi:MAG: T9SS type A sorting domain-containing protein [Bacteroidota bacterium]